MKAFQTALQSGETSFQPLPLPSLYRKGDVPPDSYRQQASGEIPRINLNLKTARFFRTIRLEDGIFTGLTSEPGALLTVVASGELTLKTGNGQAEKLIAGDVLLTPAETAPHLELTAHDGVRLLQIGVTPDWPGPEATLQDPGTPTPRQTQEPNFKRVCKATDSELAWFHDFPELFSAPLNEWQSHPPATGFRFMCWEDGFLDWHPEVINCLGMVLSGELEIEVSGDNSRKRFRAGDICVAEDRTGMGHIDWARGKMHTFLLIFADDHRWS
jgi:quercetin dioxygenase-like cupin family protein